MKFGKKWQNSGDVPLLIASSALPEQGGKKQGLFSIATMGTTGPHCPRRGKAGGGRDQSRAGRD